MNISAKWLVEQGFHGVALRIVSRVKKPELFLSEITKYEYVGIRQDGSYWHGRLTVSLSPSHPDRGTDFGVGCRSEIAAGEYDRLAQELGGVQNKPKKPNRKAERQRQAEERKDTRTREEAFAAMQPTCFDCGRKMVPIQKSNGKVFWACSGKACRFTRPTSPENRRSLRQLGYIK